MFEIGKTYKTRGGGSGTVLKILPPAPDDLYRMQAVVTNDDYEDIVDWFTLEGLLYNADKDDLDLLLPAIEPAKEGMHPEVRHALTCYRNLWAGFRERALSGEIDPCNSNQYGPLTLHISHAYPIREDAVTEADEVIAAVNALLEGGSAK